MTDPGNNKKIVKNTIILYIRMFFTMGVSLYTSRVVLNTLGIEDFGIYNVVGGIVVLFSFFDGALSTATQRFLSFEIGVGNNDSQNKVFSACMAVYMFLIIIVVLLGETVGLWFLKTQLNISLFRIEAATTAYHFSIIIFCLNILRIPYNATIIANEKMSFYAYVSIFEVMLKLGMLYLLLLLKYDKLILYGILMSIVSFVVLVIYKLYCNKLFLMSRFRFYWESVLYKKIISFSGWSLFGSLSNIMASQGINILLNIFLGVVVNAAMGITNQVRGAVFQFISNFQMAFNPQIVKSYAVNDKEAFLNLVTKASKYSYFLIFVLALPLIINLEFILDLWLGDVPKYTLEFCRISILNLMVDSMAAPLGMSVQATGKIKKYQFIYSLFSISVLPISYFILKGGLNPVLVLVSVFTLNMFALIWRVFFLKGLINLSPINYLKEVILKITAVTLITVPLPLFIYITLQNDYKRLIFTSITAVSISLISILFIGLESDERLFVNKLLKNKLFKNR